MAKVIVWDEAPMGHSDLLESLDRLLQDLKGNNEPFGGKVVILGGYFAQLPTDLPKASRAQIISASLKKSFLCSKFKVLQLKENMRVLNLLWEKEFIVFLSGYINQKIKKRLN